MWAVATPDPGSERARQAACKLANARGFVEAYRATGGKVLAGTDSPNPSFIPGYALHHELEQLVAAGRTPR